ncbi:protein sidekick-2-like [Lytechinus variegatus]|uniref:protein sidekick-2-like n=1 Tax=Lytechinus variegatus TaxID=7654 RepID=UPI001BB21DA2|nr:protein sidekick-2-like [Lytechinus variegatus]
MPIDYGWEINNTRILSPDWESNSYTFTQIGKSNIGVYRCTAMNVVGTVISRGAEIHVAYFEPYLGLPETTQVNAGEAKILTCPPYDSYPTPTITWQFNGTDIILGSDQLVTADQRLVLVQATSDHQGLYTCKAHNNVYGQTQTSPSVTLNVQGTFTPPEFIAPTIVLPPSDTVVRPGQSFVQMECIISAHPLSSLQISWQKDGVALGPTGAILKIFNPSEAHAGTYRCLGDLQGSDLTAVEASANLTMYNPVAPGITSRLERKTQEAAGNTITLPCTATGVPTPQIKWFRNAADIAIMGNSRYRLEEDGSLKLINLEKNDSGMFQCQAINDVGEQIADTWLHVQEIAPEITLAPNDTTILEGETTYLECAAEGAPNPVIHWEKDGQLVLSSTFQLNNRYILQTFGNLLLQQAVKEDSGEYTCVATNTLDSDNASASLIVYQRTIISQRPTNVETILGETSTLTCVVQHDSRVTPTITWMQDGGVIVPDGRFIILESGSLVIHSTDTLDMGLYVCKVTSVAGDDLGSANLTVLQVPYQPQGLTAAKSMDQARTIIVSWLPVFNGNSPLIRYILEQKEDDSAFTEVEATINPLLTEFPVTGVKPSRRYQYRLRAQNAIGMSEKSNPSNVVHLPEEPPDLPPQSLRASATSTSSIMVEFGEPPYESWNGPLLGYIVQWRMEGYNTAFQFHNITNYRQTSYEIVGLITWKIYEIQVAAYNGAGVGAYSNAIDVRTNEGVPTAPPQDVDIMVTSSTSFMYIFSSPPVQFINGINQGYKLLAWEPGMENNPIVELVPPNIAQSRFIGNITTLKKFTEYQASVLCYTNPGDGVPSTPVTLMTLEDVPGPVSNLRVSNVYDTSLQISWDEPLEINGVLRGYSISWQEHNKTSNIINASRLPSETSYTITSLTPQTTYLIQVWAKTNVGPGPTTDIIISSGVPPERPQPPTNLNVPDATIQSRSVELHFTPGFDGEAGITLWTVQALVGQSDHWEQIFEVSDPSARSIEVTGLEPFTYYQFRMIATNVAGSSNVSEPSEQIQTKQDAPAIAPRDVRVRAFNSTALRVTWMPLDDVEWNGIPGGYLIYWRPYGTSMQEMFFNLASPYINNHVITGLEEWMPYDVRIEAYNELHVGPTSGMVTGWTNEAVPSAGPANIQALPTFYSDILVTWNDVPVIHQNGEILGFKVIFRESGGILMYMNVPGNTSREATITHLKGYTIYTITVLAYTVVGDGAIGNEVPVRTHEWYPGPPVGITFPTVQLSSVTITWNEPLIPNGHNLSYKVGHRLLAGPPASLVEENVGGSRQHTVTGLQPQETYYFEVTAKTSMGFGLPASALVITTTNRTTPEAPSRPTVDHIKSRQVRLSWTPGYNGNSPLRYYIIDVRVGSGPWEEHNTIVDASQVSYTLTGLNPYTLYYFRLKVYNDIGASPESPSSNQITTEQDIPDGAPTILTATPITVTSLLLTWQPPLQAQTNGPLTGYRFQFRQLPSGSFMEENINDPGVTEYELLNLVRYQNYEVKLAATNSKGLGPYSVPVYVYIGEAVPSEPPSAVSISTTGSSSFQISWVPPSMESQNGGLQGYKVLYWENHSRQARSTIVQQTKTFPASATVATLDDLNCFTEYGISVKGFNAAGDGPGSPPQYSTTDEDVPSEVSHLLFSQVRMSSLNVSWGPPTSACGTVTQYKLFYQPHEPINGERTSVVVTLPSDQYSYVAKRLGERERYLFEVHAETTSFVGPRRGQNITTGPQAGAPESPRYVRLSPESSFVTVSWDAPVYYGDQPLTGYIIQSLEKGQDTWEDVNDTIAADQSQFSIPYSSLNPVTVYTFRVMAESVISVSEPALSEELMVPAAGTNLAQKNFYEEWWFLVIVALVGIIVIILVGATLCMLGRSRLYVDRKVHKRMTPDERVSVTEDGGFTSFEMDPAARRSGRNGRTNGRSGVYNRTNSYTSSNEELPQLLTFLGPSIAPPPRPSPGSIQYSEEEESKHYEDVRRRMAGGDEPGENSSLTEKNDLPSLSESLASESDVEVDGGGAHGGGPPSFVNHYASLPGTQSWRRQQTSSGPSSNAYSYTDSEPDPVPTVDGRTVYLQNNLASMQAGSRAPVHGFSSFV